MCNRLIDFNYFFIAIIHLCSLVSNDFLAKTEFHSWLNLLGGLLVTLVDQDDGGSHLESTSHLTLLEGLGSLHFVATIIGSFVQILVEGSGFLV